MTLTPADLIPYVLSPAHLKKLFSLCVENLGASPEQHDGLFDACFPVPTDQVPFLLDVMGFRCDLETCSCFAAWEHSGVEFDPEFGHRWTLENIGGLACQLLEHGVGCLNRESLHRLRHGISAENQLAESAAKLQRVLAERALHAARN